MALLFWLVFTVIFLIVKETTPMTRYGEPCFDACTKRSNWRGKAPAEYSCHKAKMYYDNIILGNSNENQIFFMVFWKYPIFKSKLDAICVI